MQTITELAYRKIYTSISNEKVDQKLTILDRTIRLPVSGMIRVGLRERQLVKITANSWRSKILHPFKSSRSNGSLK